VGNWPCGVRSPGRGFFVIQRRASSKRRCKKHGTTSSAGQGTVRVRGRSGGLAPTWRFQGLRTSPWTRTTLFQKASVLTSDSGVWTDGLAATTLVFVSGPRLRRATTRMSANGLSGRPGNPYVRCTSWATGTKWSAQPKFPLLGGALRAGGDPRIAFELARECLGALERIGEPQ
jgi:hypothetical protein